LAGNDASRNLRWFVLCSILAIGLSPLITVVSGTGDFSALVLLPIIILGWAVTRISKSDMGIRRGRPGHYAIAVLYPVVVMGLIMLVIRLAEGIRVQDFDPQRILFVIAVNSVMGVILGLLTEEGLFRGLLWGLLRSRMEKPTYVLMLTSLIFLLWHVPVVLLEFGGDFPRSAVPIYLGNVLLLGLNWGLMRMVSGSVIVASVSHALWNALAYKFFGFGSEYGVLTTSSFRIFDPERGLVGLALNAVVFAVFFRWARSRT
jgi:membrane protease YdiL (CAAX protease family)